VTIPPPGWEKVRPPGCHPKFCRRVKSYMAASAVRRSFANCRPRQGPIGVKGLILISPVGSTSANIQASSLPCNMFAKPFPNHGRRVARERRRARSPAAARYMAGSSNIMRGAISLGRSRQGPGPTPRAHHASCRPGGAALDRGSTQGRQPQAWMARFGGFFPSFRPRKFDPGAGKTGQGDGTLRRVGLGLRSLSGFRGFHHFGDPSGDPLTAAR